MGIVLFIVIYYQSFSQRKSVLRELAQRYRRQQINANNKQQTEN
jgi:heme exporter protein D